MMLVAAAPDCASANSHVRWRECAVLERDRAEAALNDEFQTTLRLFKQLAEKDIAIARAGGISGDEYRKSQEGYVTSLLRSQEAWMTYQKEYCHAGSFPGGMETRIWKTSSAANCR